MIVGTLQLGDLVVEIGRLLLQRLALGRLLSLALLCFGQPLLRIAVAATPFALLAPGAAVAFAIGGGFARLGRSFCALVGDGACVPGRCGAGAFDLLFEPRRIRQGGQRLLGHRNRIAGRVQHRIEILLPLGERAALGLDPLERRGGRIGRARRIARVAFARQSGGPRFIGERAEALHFGHGRVALGKRVRDRGLAAGKLSCQRRKPISADQPLGGRGAGAGRHEPIPPAQAAVGRDQPLANRKHLPLVFIGNRDLPQAAQKF